MSDLLSNQSTGNRPPLEVWAGIECTINRVENQYFNQLNWNGHLDRIEDLELFAKLGVRTLRYPVLWEMVAPHGLAQADWTWADKRLERLRALGIRPVVGFLHHGSGPLSTHLLDPNFPEKLAEYAGAFAQRFPWVDLYTPVNEPLTTARFSGLYGIWYPHAASDQAFLTILFNELHGVQLAMQAIRETNPCAGLVQTEDIGKVFATPQLQYQASFENKRRWLTYDVLCGRFEPLHALFSFCEQALPVKILDQAQQIYCPPDVLGVNYYVTSERFLDAEVKNYPGIHAEGNQFEPYVDVEAVRVCKEGLYGQAAILMETWRRYQLPIVITEAHLGSTREEQLRWLMDTWRSASTARQQGADLQAVTVWSMLGAFNWNSLVMRDEGYYEPGVFDIRSRNPRQTLLAQAVEALVRQGEYDHPALDSSGWWHRPERLLYPSRQRGSSGAIGPLPAVILKSQVNPRWLMIVGRDGTLARAFQRICSARGLAFRAFSRKDLDLTQPEAIGKLLENCGTPWAVVNTAGYVRVDDAEREPDLCRLINTQGAVNLARICSTADLPFLTFSSDLVFDGEQRTPYLESGQPAPLNVYGRSKADAEEQVLAHHPDTLVIRTSAFFGPWDEFNFATLALRRMRAGKTTAAVGDVLISPTYVPDLAHTCLDLLLDGEHGIWHLANQGELSWGEFGRAVARVAGFSDRWIEERSAAEFAYPALRPPYSALDSERGRLMPDLGDALTRYYRDLEVAL